MESFIAFVIDHWLLASVWLALLLALLYNESLRGGNLLSPQQATALINEHNALIVDIRSEAEFRSGHLPQAINLPSAELCARLQQMHTDKQRPILLVCKTGQNTGSVGVQLKKAGFGAISRLRGGMLEWQGQSLPLIKSK